MARRFGGRFSPGARPSEDQASGAPARPAMAAGKPTPFRNRRTRRVGMRARLMFILPLPLLAAGIGAINRGNALEMLTEIGGFATLILAAWLLREGLRAQEAYDDRKVARPPAMPRKLIAAILCGLGVFLVGALSLGQGLFGGLAFGIIAAIAHVAAFGLDPMKKKGMEGVDEFATERVARAIDRAETLVREINGAASRIGDRRLERRIEGLCDQARDVFRVVEEDPRDLPRAHTFLSVYLQGLRDATIKFADLYGRTGDTGTRAEYEALLADLETSFSAHRTDLLEDNRSDLDVEIEVLRDRLQQDGLSTR